MKTPLLSVEQLGIRAGGRSIVRQVSFTAQAGSVTAVIGPNGAGKTSLLEGIVGLREADGDVRFSGELLTSFSSRARTFAYQPDKAEPAVEATVRTLVAHAFAASSGSPDRTELRRLFDIDPLLDLGAGVLSHGERQRLALFSTLVLARPVVVLDEPFSAFDPLQLRDVLQAIRRVAASGATVLASIHQLADAEKIADHVVFLAEGRTIATGSVAELKAEAGDPALSLEAAFVHCSRGARVRRELAIALRARATWLVAALAALLVGHGFVLAIDLYSASSRSALASLLQTREMDPLAGVVRPTLGGVDLVLSLLAPLIAARSLAIEKERGTYGALCLATGATWRVIARKAVAATAALALVLVPPSLLFAAFRAAGGHVDLLETGVAFAGVVLHLLLVAAIGTAAAAWTRTLAQAATLGILASLSSWAIDAADGFAALAWLGGASAWSIEQHLAPFQRGIVALGAVSWLTLAIIVALALAFVGGSFAPLSRKLAAAALVAALGVLLLSAANPIRRAFDWSQERRASLPPAAVQALRALPQPITIEVFLDRDDGRRRQVESDALSKLVLARPDLTLLMPLDTRPNLAEAEHGADYGRIVLRVGDAVRETRSTSRRELTTLIFEAAGRPTPTWNQPTYPGFPVDLSGPARSWLALLAYAGLPLGFGLIGFTLTRRRTSR